MCSEEHRKKDEDFLKTHHMADTVLDTFHCILYYLGIHNKQEIPNYRVLS